MKNQDWESKINELRDAQLVKQRLIELNERRWNERFERNEHIWNQRFERHDNEIAELRATMASLIEHVDRFIQGRQSNGH
ncbi:MAG: hypothetical protein HYX72_14940 [Acidobacteria bacterium]|nr:hypothetical protein [Acidobacteriota bacterium]